MASRLAYLNETCPDKSLVWRNDRLRLGAYHAAMATPKHDWYLSQWLSTLKKRQADIVRDLDWNKARVSLTASGKQAYTRDDINEIAGYLNLRPYELLMHPDDAMAMRRLQADMIRLAHQNMPNEAPVADATGKFVSAG